jgi:Rod binding domain-containing protein
MSGTSTALSSALTQMRNAKPAQPSLGGKNVDAAAKDFEAMFVGEMLSHMFEGVKSDSMFGGGKGEEMFKGLLISEYGKKIAEGKGLGISDQIKGMMIQMQQQGASKA